MPKFRIIWTTTVVVVVLGCLTWSNAMITHKLGREVGDDTQATPMYKFGSTVGDAQMTPGNDNFEAVVMHDSPIRLNILGVLYDKFFISSNGFLSFGQGIEDNVARPFPISGYIILSALWTDLNTDGCGGDGNKIYYRQLNHAHPQELQDISAQVRDLGGPSSRRVFRARWAAIITFDRVRKATSGCDGVRNTFQMILATDGRRTFGIVNYQVIDWIGSDGTFPVSGFNSGDGVTFLDIPEARSASFGQLELLTNVGVQGRFIYQLDTIHKNDIPCDKFSIRRTITTVAPKFGSMFGGTEVMIGGICGETSSQAPSVVCRFGANSVTGERFGDYARCISPLLAGKGEVPLQVSIDGGMTFPYSSTFLYDPVIYDIRLRGRNNWATKGFKLTWDQHVFDPDQHHDPITVDVDFFGWFISGQNPIDGVRMMHLPIAQDVPNSGVYEVPINSVQFKPDRSYLGLNGVFRIVKTADRRNFSSDARGWSKRVQMIWSQTTGAEVFTLDVMEGIQKPIATPKRKNTGSKPNKAQAEYAKSLAQHQTTRAPYITPAFGRDALQALTIDPRSESILTPAQWATFYSGQFGARRLDLARDLIRHHSSHRNVHDFCLNWAGAFEKFKQQDALDYNQCGHSYVPCPPTEAHARRDIGRWAPVQSSVKAGTCNKSPRSSAAWERGDCEDHPGAELCVETLFKLWQRRVHMCELQQQCCYGQDGNLLDATEKGGGGRLQIEPVLPDFPEVEPANLWLAQKIDSYLFNQKDVEICCRSTGSWTGKSCRVLRRNRRGSTTAGYIPPSVPGQVFGDPHIATLDGLQYDFNGLGEYVLFQMPEKITIQGRTAKAAVPEGRISEATIFSGLAIKMLNTVVQVSLGAGDQLQIYADGKLLELNEFSHVIELKDFSVHLDRAHPESEIPNKLAILSSTGIALELENQNAVLQFTISLPAEYTGSSTSGLLGVRNGNPDDDLLPRGSSVPLPKTASLEEIFRQFGETWRVSRTETLFTYDGPGETYDTVNQLDFQPSFTIPSLPADIKEEAERLCGGNAACLFDIAMTGNLAVGKQTAEVSVELKESIRLSSEKIVRCGFPNITASNVQLVKGSSYLVGDRLEYACYHDDPSVRVVPKSGDATLVCSESGQWTGTPLVCAVLCEKPDLNPSVAVLQEKYAYEQGDIVNFACVDNKVVEYGDLQSRCMEDGTWTGEPLECVASCNRPVLSSSRVLLQETDASFLEGRTIQLQCAENSLYISGDLTATCSETGVWNGSQVICEAPTTTAAPTTTSTTPETTTTSPTTTTASTTTSTTPEPITTLSTTTTSTTSVTSTTTTESVTHCYVCGAHSRSRCSATNLDVEQCQPGQHDCYYVRGTVKSSGRQGESIGGIAEAGCGVAPSILLPVTNVTVESTSWNGTMGCRPFSFRDNKPSGPLRITVYFYGPTCTCNDSTKCNGAYMSLTPPPAVVV